MSYAKVVLLKNKYMLLDHKGKEINMEVVGDFDYPYHHVEIWEGRNYFEDYLKDDGAIFGNKFSGMVPLGLEDVKNFGYELCTIDMSRCDKEDMRLPWFQGQRVVHVLLKPEDGISSKFDVLTTKPKDIEFLYNIQRKTIKMMSPTASQKGYREYPTD